MAYPRFQTARAFKFTTRTAGNITVTSGAYVAADVSMDITLAAQIGDVMEVSVGAMWNVATVSSDWSKMSAATRVSGADVNYIQGGSSGFVGAWFVTAGDLVPASGSVMYTVVAGDISAGTVTWQLKIGTNAGTRVLRAEVATPLYFAVKNLGPADPN